MHFSALFGEVFRQTALSSLTFEREFFSCLPAGFFKHSLLRVTEKMQETRVTVFPPYPWQEYQTIWRFHSLGSSTVSSDILRLWMLARSRAWALDLRRSTTWTNQMAVFESLLTFSYTFNPHNRIDTPDTIDTWGAVTCHKPHNPLLTKSGNRMLMAYIWKNPPFLIALIKVGSNWTATVVSSRHST